MTNLNPIRECNAREVEMMVGKAMCAYANWTYCEDNMRDVKEKVGSEEWLRQLTAHKSEYEATVRIIEMFVTDSIYAIQAYVVDRAEEQFGIK